MKSRVYEGSFCNVNYFVWSYMADENQAVELKDEGAELAPFDPSKKKKKKKVVIQEPGDDSVDKLAEKTESLSVSEGIENAFVGLKKKKKKQVEIDLSNEDNADNQEDLDDRIGEDEEGEGIILEQPRYAWEGSDRDYEYEEPFLSWMNGRDVVQIVVN
ncbi:hypothetical protein ACHQM5_021946 [Ranunculus cassubicifolius]